MKKRLLMSILFIGVSLCSCGKEASLSNQSTMIDNGVTFEASCSSEKYSEITQPEETANFINGLLFSTEYDVVDYCQGCFIVSKNDGLLYGVLDMHGNELIPCDYDEIEFLNKDAVINGSEDELLIDLCYENLHTIIDNTGEIIIENSLEYIRCIEYEIGNATDKGAYFLGTSSNALSLYTKAGDQLIHLNFPGASSITFGPMISENYFMVWIMEQVPNEKIATFIDTSYLYNMNGEIINQWEGPCQTSHDLADYDNMAEILIGIWDRQFWTIDENGISNLVKEYTQEEFKNLKLQNAYINISQNSSNKYSNEFINLVETNGTWKLLDLAGNPIHEKRYYTCREYEDTYCLSNEDNEAIIVNQYGEIVVDYGWITATKDECYFLDSIFNLDNYFVGNDGVCYVNNGDIYFFYPNN